MRQNRGSSFERDRLSSGAQLIVYPVESISQGPIVRFLKLHVDFRSALEGRHEALLSSRRSNTCIQQGSQRIGLLLQGMRYGFCD